MLRLTSKCVEKKKIAIKMGGREYINNLSLGAWMFSRVLGILLVHAHQRIYMQVRTHSILKECTLWLVSLICTYIPYVFSTTQNLDIY